MRAIVAVGDLLRLIDALYKWRLNLNSNTLYILSLVPMFPNKAFFYMNARLSMYKYCYSNLGTIYVWSDDQARRWGQSIMPPSGLKELRHGLGILKC